MVSYVPSTVHRPPSTVHRPPSTERSFSGAFMRLTSYIRPDRNVGLDEIQPSNVDSLRYEIQ